MRLRFSFPAPASNLRMEADAALRLAERAASMVNVRLDVRHVHTLRSGTVVEIRCGLKLRERGNIPAQMPLPYQRISSSGDGYAEGGRRPRRVAAVCWHGHRDFFRVLYSLLDESPRTHPGLRIMTGLATYNDAEHFERTFPESDRNIGSLYRPMLASEAQGGASRAAWAVAPEVNIDRVERWVRSRGDMKFVNVVNLDTYRPPRGTAHFHIYVADADHPGAQ